MALLWVHANICVLIESLFDNFMFAFYTSVPSQAWKMANGNRCKKKRGGSGEQENYLRKKDFTFFSHLNMTSLLPVISSPLNKFYFHNRV